MEELENNCHNGILNIIVKSEIKLEVEDDESDHLDLLTEDDQDKSSSPTDPKEQMPNKSTSFEEVWIKEEVIDPETEAYDIFNGSQGDIFNFNDITSTSPNELPSKTMISSESLFLDDVNCTSEDLLNSNSMKTGFLETKKGHFICRYCSYKATFRCWMKRHVKAVHVREREFICEHCPYRTSFKSNLVQHVTAIHERKVDYPCEHCSRTFSRVGSLRKHISGVHKKIQPFTCDLCSFKSSQKVSLIRHLNEVHMKNKPYACEICNFKSSRKFQLFRHIDSIHHSPVFHTCSLCSYKTKLKKCLTTHISKKHSS